MENEVNEISLYDERAKFEHHYGPQLNYHRGADGQYWYTRTAERFDGWIAAKRSLQAEKQPQKSAA